MPSDRENPGVLLVGHGTRSPHGVAEFLDLARQVEVRLAPWAVEPAFLELAEPTIDAGFLRLAQRGVRRIVVAPLLLFAAGHAKQDIPAAVRDAAGILPPGEIDIVYAQPLGCHPALLELSGGRVRELLASRSVIAPSESCLLLVGRGSRDPEAIAATHDYARLVHAGIPPLDKRVAFVAMAAPRVESVAEELSQSNLRRIVVLPHLLFHGELYESLAALVRSRSRAAQEWLLVPYLAHGRQAPALQTVGSQPPAAIHSRDLPPAPSAAADGVEPASSASNLVLTAILDRIQEALHVP
ncbi:MAG: sirohydrochlorin chelatase [Pirellulaceae bacterium]|nr:sirohydrochlorin chelatase [Pirellulaceae bacterium]